MMNNHKEWLSAIQDVLKAPSSKRWIAIGEKLSALQDIPADFMERDWRAALRGEIAKSGDVLSSAYLSKILSAAEFVQSLQTKDPMKYSWANMQNVALLSVDVARRMYNISEEKGGSLFDEIMDKGITYHTALEKYDAFKQSRDAVVSARHVASTKTRQAHEALLENIESNQIHLFGEFGSYIIHDGQQGMPYGLSFDLCAEKKIEQRSVFYGFEIIYFPAEKFRSTWRRKLSGVALAATFFEQFWIIADAKSGDFELIQSELRDLKLNNIGLIHQASSEAFVIIKKPTAPPVPDRRALLRRALKISPK